MLSAVSQQIQTIQEALKSQVESSEKDKGRAFHLTLLAYCLSQVASRWDFVVCHVVLFLCFDKVLFSVFCSR